MQTQILFWNFDGQSSAIPLLLEVAGGDHPSVIFLAEVGAIVKELHEALAVLGYLWVSSDHPKVSTFARNVSLAERFVEHRFIGFLATVENEQFHLVAAHLPSKVKHHDADIETHVRSLSTNLRKAEDKSENFRSFVIGDLNLDPHNPTIMGADCLHAVPDSRIAAAGERTVDFKNYRLAYNPMWSFYGDRSDGPPGTHYYRGKQVSQEWHMYDQIIVSASALHLLQPDSVKILDAIGDTPLTTDAGRPRTGYPGHFPIQFSLGAQNDKQGQ